MAPFQHACATPRDSSTTRRPGTNGFVRKARRVGSRVVAAPVCSYIHFWKASPRYATTTWPDRRYLAGMLNKTFVKETLCAKVVWHEASSGEVLG